MSEATKLVTSATAAPELPEQPEHEPEEEKEVFDPDEQESEDDEGDDGEEGDEEESSVTGASDAEEEARYANEPGCGLSPRLVIRRGCEQLTANDPPPPPISRNDTLAGFDALVRSDPVKADLAKDCGPSVPEAPVLSRVDTMSGLPEVRDAFNALDDDDSLKDPSSTTTSSLKATASSESLEPMPVHRVDTMELLLGGEETMEDAANKNEDEGRRAAKRQRSGLTA